MSADQIIEVEAEVGSFPKNASSSVVGRVTRVHGVRCVDLRVFAVNTAGESVPTRAGVCVRTEQLPELQKLVAALVAASAEGAAGDGGSNDAPGDVE